jgi:cyclase
MKHNPLRQWVILFLGAVIGLVLVLTISKTTVAQKTPLNLTTASLKLEQVGTNIYTLISSTDYPPTNENIAICNAGIIIGDDGVLIIDPFQSEALGNLLLSEVKKITDLPVKYVLNTHFHFDHTGGNKAIKAQQIALMGRGSIREDMLTRNLEDDPNPVPPEVILNSDSSIWLGQREVQLKVVEGHSGGTDIIAYVPDANVLFTGDILFNQRFPYMADGNIKKWQQTLNNLSQNYPNTKIVPGHGSIGDRDTLIALNNYFTELETIALKWKTEGLSEAAAIKSASAIPPEYKDYKFQRLYPTNLKTAYEQITLSQEN